MVKMKMIAGLVVLCLASAVEQYAQHQEKENHHCLEQCACDDVFLRVFHVAA